eukprot:scaffold11423_cov123-Isochrysis_galbana.AAC.5
MEQRSWSVSSASAALTLRPRAGRAAAATPGNCMAALRTAAASCSSPCRKERRLPHREIVRKRLLEHAIGMREFLLPCEDLRLQQRCGDERRIHFGAVGAGAASGIEVAVEEARLCHQHVPVEQPRHMPHERVERHWGARTRATARGSARSIERQQTGGVFGGASRDVRRLRAHLGLRSALLEIFSCDVEHKIRLQSHEKVIRVAHTANRGHVKLERLIKQQDGGRSGAALAGNERATQGHLRRARDRRGRHKLELLLGILNLSKQDHAPRLVEHHILRTRLEHARLLEGGVGGMHVARQHLLHAWVAARQTGNRPGHAEVQRAVLRLIAVEHVDELLDAADGYRVPPLL